MRPVETGSDLSHARQAGGFIIFFLILAIGGLLWGLLDAGASQIFATTLNQTSDPAARSVIEERQAIWQNLLLFIVVLAGVFLVARAVLQSRS